MWSPRQSIIWLAMGRAWGSYIDVVKTRTYPRLGRAGGNVERGPQFCRTLLIIQPWGILRCGMLTFAKIKAKLNGFHSVGRTLAISVRAVFEGKGEERALAKAEIHVGFRAVERRVVSDGILEAVYL